MSDEPSSSDSGTQPGEADRTSDRLVPCARCGYNISGQKIGAPCPECGTQIGQYPVADTGTNGSAVAALVLGIFSIVGCASYGALSVIFGPLAIYFAKRAKLNVMSGNAPRSSLSVANAGRICGIIGTVIGGLYLLAIVAFVGLTLLGVVSGTFSGPRLIP